MKFMLIENLSLKLLIIEFKFVLMIKHQYIVKLQFI